ncbi:MAG: hypothetical protein M1823_003880 [Watsoniomyces obsoletus]|nr:MAG: hypothetical protein M1823_003880 [Watsoniomyces obsoletus]
MPRAPMRWTVHEDEILRREAAAQLNHGSIRDWNRIATQLPGRTNKDCRKRWYNKVAGGLRKGPWQPEEDTRLREAIREHGQRWTVVAPCVGTRSAEQCAKRWIHSLDPALDHSEWTAEEDQCLMSAIETHGHSWKEIQRLHYPGRSRDSIKNRHTILSRKAEAVAVHRDDAPCCPPVRDPSSPRTPDDSHTIFSSGEVTSADGSTISSPSEDSRRKSYFDSSGSMSPRVRRKAEPAGDEHHDPTLSTGYAVNTPTSATTRSGSRSIASISPFETPDMDSNMFFEQPFNFLDWSASPRALDHETPNLSDVMSCATTFDSFPAPSLPAQSDPSWVQFVEQTGTSRTQEPTTIPSQVLTATTTSSIAAGKDSKIRLVLEAPSIETTNAVMELLLKAGAKVSMEADTRCVVTLILENVMTATINAVLEVLIRSRTKIRMEANSGA